MPLTPRTRITAQEDRMIFACIQARKELLAHTQRLVGAIENIQLTLPNRMVLLELLEAYRDAVWDRHRAIAEVCAQLHAVDPPS